MIRKTLFAFAALLFLTSLCHAQTGNVAIVGGGAFNSNSMGYRRAAPELSFDLDFRKRRVEFVNRFQVDWSEKLKTGQGWQINESAIGRYYLLPNFFVGGGGRISHLDAGPVIKKSNFSPLIQTGFLLVSGEKFSAIPYITIRPVQFGFKNETKGFEAGTEFWYPIGRRFGLKGHAQIGTLWFKVGEEHRRGTTGDLLFGVYWRF